MDTPKQVVRELKKGHVGERFQRLHKKRQRSEGRLKSWHFWLGGAAVIAIGVGTYPVPFIPSELIILIGFALLAQASMRGARLLDGLEVHLRGRWGWLLKYWRPLPKVVKVMVSAATSTALGALSYVLFRALMD